ncbi:DUF7662 domain-containing protein [Paenibacillus hemerocallicola]|jgi:hypothetical protein|uniref:DUF7662 domain-containing protein n=1 Tax=Paenibacillus hemerocallicola TaxID=1172614 RepID=UPI0026CD9A5E
MHKYKQLEQFLYVQKNTKVTLAFEQIEEILGFSLPKTAKTQCHWWSNTISDSRSPAIAWLRTFRRVSHVEPGKHVTFSRSLI